MARKKPKPTAEPIDALWDARTALAIAQAHASEASMRGGARAERARVIGRVVSALIEADDANDAAALDVLAKTALDVLAAIGVGPFEQRPDGMRALWQSVVDLRANGYGPKEIVECIVGHAERSTGELRDLLPDAPSAEQRMGRANRARLAVERALLNARHEEGETTLTIIERALVALGGGERARGAVKRLGDSLGKTGQI